MIGSATLNDSPAAGSNLLRHHVKTCQCDWILHLGPEDCICTISPCVSARPLSHQWDTMSQSATLPQKRQTGFTPNSNLMCPFSLRAMHHVVQSLPHFSVRMKPTSCHKTCFPLTPILEEDVIIVFAATKCLQPSTHAPARNQTSLTHRHHTRLTSPHPIGEYEKSLFMASSQPQDF